MATVSGASAADVGAAADSSAAVGGGEFGAMMGELRATFDEAQRRNVEMRKLTTEEGTELGVAKKGIQPV
ncbi:hypothetical protein [Pseudaestuariivita rosea]|uniref:hypothetical protein n=1 Tax=Pseudaestuariivita rosea TaxID=2763263 RepID=UPI001ABB446E|nr:hypothetical protein [Pseudaestuariivita rosea]